MRLPTISGIAAVALLALMQNASAYTITASTTGPTPFNVYSPGTTASTGYLNSTTINNPGFDITSIVFAGGTSPNLLSGVYAGSVSGVTATPYGFPTPQANSGSNPEYLVAQPGPGQGGLPPGTVTITWDAAQNQLLMLWGTVDSAAGYNVVLTNAGVSQTITGAQILAAIGNPTSGADNAWVEITGLNSFTSATFSANQTAFEFSVGTVPEPTSLALLGTTLAGFGWLNRRRLRKSVKSA